MFKVHSAEASLNCKCLPPHTLSNTFSASALVRLVPWLVDEAGSKLSAFSGLGFCQASKFNQITIKVPETGVGERKAGLFPFSCGELLD